MAISWALEVIQLGMSDAIVNVNGQILPPDQATVSVFDRGYLYGDSLYEVTRSYDGKFFKLKDHLSRLKKSAELCQMALNQDLTLYEKEIYRTFEAFRTSSKTEAYCRIIISRGAGKIGFGLNCLKTPTLYTIIVQPVDAPTPESFEKGFRLKISARLRNDRRALDPAMKSGNYLNSLLAYLEATRENFDDALLCNEEGHVAEGTTFNVFYARRGILATPPLDIGILDGITRKLVIDLASQIGIETREIRFPRERLYEADEIFLSSSVREVFPITAIDGKKINNGEPGPITRKLHEAYQQLLG